MAEGADGFEVAAFDNEGEGFEVEGLVVGDFGQANDLVAEFEVADNVVFRHQRVGALGDFNDVFCGR